MPKRADDPPPKQRIIFDGTHTFQSGANTGIQRVVRNLTYEAAKIAASRQLSCLAVVRHKKRYFVTKPQQGDSRSALWEATVNGYRSLMGALLAPFPFPRLHRQLLPPRGRRGIFNLPYLLGRFAYRTCRASLCRLGLAEHYLAKPSAGDLLVIMEVNSYRDADWKFIDAAHERGALVGAVIYDLIPLHHPELFNAKHAAKFHQWFHELAERADFFVCISDTVRQDVEQYVQKHITTRDWRPEQFHHIRLGADFATAQPAEKSVRASVERYFQNTAAPTFLSVGTIEPRKNHRYLLDAFELAWARGAQTRLCIVGRVGWHCEEMVGRMMNHPELGQRLVWFNDLSDAELTYCYQHAEALAFPSLMEGFGLPLVEGLQHGLTVLASDIPIHREVGGEFCDYFSLDDPQELAAKVVQLEAGRQSPAVRAARHYPMTTWRETATQFVDICRRQLTAPNAQPQPASTRRAA